MWAAPAGLWEQSKWPLNQVVGDFTCARIEFQVKLDSGVEP